MKLFPFILARICGLPFDLLEQISLQSHKELEAIEAKYVLVEKHKNELIELLDTSSNNIHCAYVLKNLSYLKKNLQHGKKLKLSDKLESNLDENEKPFYKKIEKQLELYLHEIANLAVLENEFDRFYKREISNNRLSLQKMAHESVILKGLLMSSHSFLRQLEKYSEANINSFAKKQFQTERGFLKYLSRICSKTSPFSTFTTLSLFNLESEENPDFVPKSFIRLNNHLFTLWRDALNNYPPFYRKLKVSLNPSIKQKDEYWVYLFNTRNVESIQKIENNEVLEFIYKNINGVGEEVVFKVLTSKLLAVVETEISSLEAYLLELIDYGFLEWRWPFSGLDPFWDRKLKKLLESFDDDTFLAYFATELTIIQSKVSLAESSDFSEKRQLQFETFEAVKQLSQLLLNRTQLADKEKLDDAGQLKHFKINQFLFSPERLFYEDVRKSFKSTLKATEIAPMIQDLEDLLECVDVLFFNSTQSKLKLFFLEYYKKSEEINLFSFYEHYYQNESKIELGEKNDAVLLRLEWQKEIINNSKLSDDGILTIELDLIMQLSQKVKSSSHLEKKSSRGTLIQIFREGNILKGFTDTSFEGSGKMMGRFLHLFPQNITHAEQNWNDKLRGDLLWVENVDASIYNPNLHPPLLPFEIRMPGSQNTLPPEKQISANELVIVYDYLQDKLALIHKPTERKVYVFDMGFEALESRSPLYQLLATFNYQSSSQSIIAEIVNHYFNKNENQNIYFQPRICVGKHLVIQRKRWFVSKDSLPLKHNSEKESAYFIRINRWIKSNQFHSKVFITLKPGELEKEGREKTDNYKPQYIDFESPVFVQLFHKLIKKVETKLKIEEFLPFPEEQLEDGNYATEYLIQWETKSNKKRDTK